MGERQGLMRRRSETRRMAAKTPPPADFCNKIDPERHQADGDFQTIATECERLKSIDGRSQLRKSPARDRRRETGH